MNALIDTQILLMQFKRGDMLKLPGKCIASITANEFLWVHRENYYIIHPAHLSGMRGFAHSVSLFRGLKNKRGAKMLSNYTDQLIIDFNNRFPPYREYGLQAVASIINESNLPAFELSIIHVEKKKRKCLRKRIRFLINSGYNCIPPNPPTISVAMDLFFKFTEQHKYNCKKEIRNSINDIIILATAVERRMRLISKDNLLNRFAAKECHATLKGIDGRLDIDFTVSGNVKRKKTLESKGYINQGWSYSIWNGKSVYGGN